MAQVLTSLAAVVGMLLTASAIVLIGYRLWRF
jgi:hypothetical protein